MLPNFESNDLNSPGFEKDDSDVDNEDELLEKCKGFALKGNKPFQRQLLIACGTFLLTLGAGATAGYSAILIPQIQEEQGRRKYSTQMMSWVAASASMAMLFGNLLSGYLMERFGRRLSQIMCACFYISGWGIIGFAQNVYWILLGRFITGLSQGWLGPLGPVFVGEISSPIYRGLLLAGLSLAIALGVLFSHLFGTFLHWKYSSLLCGLFPLIGGIIIYFAPETPVWFASKNRIEECMISFKWYRGLSPEMKVELDKMISDRAKKDETKSKITMLRENIKKPEFWKPLSIMGVFFIMTQLSGVNVICAYTTDIMKGLVGHKKYSYSGMIAIDIMRCASLAVACILLKRRGRRPMVMFSGILTALSLITLSIYLYVVRHNHISPIITLGLMSVYMIVSNMGVVPLPWNMVGELFASETKGLGSGISVMMTSIAYFGAVKSAPDLFETIGFKGTFLFYGLSTLLGTIFLYFYLPETKGKTLLQIEEHFRYGKKGKTKEKDTANEACEPCV